MMTKLDLSQLPGTHRDRVFLGGSYAHAARSLLEELEQAVTESGFVPIIADRFALLQEDRDIHDVTLWLLHACRLAVFEVSTHSGALMEVERLRDYGMRRVLCLYHEPRGRKWPADEGSWKTTQMLKSLAREQESLISVRSYARPEGAIREAKAFLRAIKRSRYGRLHGF